MIRKILLVTVVVLSAIPIIIVSLFIVGRTNAEGVVRQLRSKRLCESQRSS